MPTTLLLVAGCPAPWARRSKRPAGTSRSCPSPHLLKRSHPRSPSSPAGHTSVFKSRFCLPLGPSPPGPHYLEERGTSCTLPLLSAKAIGPTYCPGSSGLHRALSTTQSRSGCDPIHYTPQVLPLRTSCSFWIRLILAEASPFTGSLTEFHSNLSRSFGGILALLPVQLQSFPFLYYMGAE